MKHLGINQPDELPEYEKLNSNEALDKLLNPEQEEINKEQLYDF